MSVQMIGVIGIVLLLVLMVLRVPVAYAMLSIGLIGMAYLRGWSAGVQAVTTTLFSKFTSYSYSAVPLFILMGYLAFYSGILEELFDVVKKWVGHLPGGLTDSGIVAGAGFGAVCGSGNASSATLSRVVVPELLKSGTNRSIAFGSVCASGILAPLIPPSVIGMLIAVVLEVSIGKVLMGGLMPGVILCLLFCAYTTVRVITKPELAPTTARFSWTERIKALPRCWDFAIIVLIVFVGIYTGLFTATEAGAVSSAAIIVILLIKKKSSLKLLVQALTDTMRTTASAFFIVGTAFVFSAFLTLTRIPNAFATWLVSLPVHPLVILLGITAFFLIIGMFMDVMSVIYITIPILAPTVEGLGYSLVWFAVLLLMMTAIAAITPPFGGSLFVMRASIPDSTMKEIYSGVLPFVIIAVVFSFLCVIFPQIILFLPNAMLG